MFLQANAETLHHWMLFDLDDPHAWFLPEERGLPTPTYIAVNRSNGHAHVGYLLETPVSFYDASRAGPIKFLVAVERGFTRRMGADFGYSGHLTRNPFHPQHETDWQAGAYRLDELNDSLDPKDKRWVARSTETTGTGRNVTIFDEVRQYAYRQVLKFKKAGKDECAFRQHLMDMASEVNRCNYKKNGLVIAELFGIAKSVAKWTWAEFTLAKFSAKQSARIARRWSGKETAEKLRPWDAEGISRRTFYYRKSRRN